MGINDRTSVVGLAENENYFYMYHDDVFILLCSSISFFIIFSFFFDEWRICKQKFNIFTKKFYGRQKVLRAF